jgi:hypothetical protein
MTPWRKKGQKVFRRWKERRFNPEKRPVEDPAPSLYLR